MAWAQGESGEGVLQGGAVRNPRKEASLTLPLRAEGKAGEVCQPLTFRKGPRYEF